MNIHKLKMDTSGNVEDISFVLAKKNGDKIGNISNIENVVAKHSFKEASEFTFTSHKKMNNNMFKYWDELKDFKLVWIPEWDMWYEATVEVNEKDDNVKNVSGKTLGEAELSQIMIYGIEINTETDIARDDYKIPTTFYKSDHPEASLMNRLLDEKAPHYKIKHIDKSLMNLQRTFTFNDISLYDAFQEISEELNCLFVFNCGSNENGKPERSISVYDLESNCLDCGYRETFTNKCPKCGSTNIQLGYGEYTNVFISKDNLADEITYSVDTDSVKNCFKLEAGDDLMTAAVRACNPNGTDYIYYLPDETRTEMSQELQDKLKSYDALYEEYQTSHKFNLDDSFVTNYNALVKKYGQYDDTIKDTEITNPIVGYPKLMRIYFDTIDMVQFLRNKLMPLVSKPDNNAKSQGEYLMANLPSSASTTSLKNLSVSTADNIMVSLAQTIVKGSFKITVTESTLSNNVWKGKFNLKSYTDDDDKFTSQFVLISINENYESYVKQRIDSILNNADNNYFDIVGLFKQDMSVFKSQLKKYCLDSLQSFQKCCQSCIDLMVQQGISSNNSSSIYGINTKTLYENIYIPYYNKLNAIQDEIKVRENEVYTIEGRYNNQNELVQDGVQIEIERMISEVQDVLNFKNYIGITLYKEFSSFLRMDKYSNTNYVSDGLNNTDLMKNAIEFINVATKELFKSATLQHSITGTIKNFLRMKEFEPVTNNFKNGNWICVGIDDQVYQLRIIEYEIDFSDTQNISVTFSDVVSLPDGMSDLESILANSSKMATSYNGVVRQSTINTNFKNKMSEMIRKGLDMTNTKIVSNADNQDITWDDHGLLCREYDEIIDDYTDSQLKIINHGIYITDDNWKTARAGIGNFIYYDPKDKTYKESYGVIADTLVSNLILTSEVGIYNEEKSIEMAKDGIIVTTNTMNKNVFTIRKEITDDEGNVSYERQLYIDDNGNIRLAGNASIAWDNVTGTENVVVKDTLNKFLESIQQQLDGKVETFRQETDPSLEWTDEEKAKHNGDLWYNTKTNLTYIYNGNGWDEFTGDVPDEVWDKIDGKSQIFIKTPVPPYNTGDLWFTESKELFTCIQDRKEGESFNSADWEKKVNYTDDTTANGVKSDLEKLAHVLGYNGTTITGTYIYSPHILGGELSIGDTKVNASISTSGKLTATGAEITGKIIATDGVFSGSLNAATGTFSGTLSGVNGTFVGKLSGATGSFTGSVIATSITAKQSYSIYYNDVGTGEPTDSVQVITAFDWGTNTSQIGFGLIDSSLDSSKMLGMLLIKEQDTRILTLVADDINTRGWLNIDKINITDSSGQNKGVPYQQIKWNPSTTFDFNGYNHHHTILPYKNGNFAVGMESTTPGMLTISLLPYLLTTETDTYGNITVSKEKDTTSQISIGATSNPYACIYVDAIYLTGDKKTYTSLANLGDGGTTNYNGLTNKPKINNVELASGNNTLSDLGIAAKSHSHSGYIPKSGTSTLSPITGTLHMANGKGWDMTDYNGNEVTGIYCNYTNGINKVMIADNSYQTIIRGNGIQLGNNSTIINIPYLPNYTSANKYLVADDSGNIGWRNVTQGKAYDLANASIYGVMCLYNSTGSYTDGTMTQKAATDSFGSQLYYSSGRLYLRNTNSSNLDYVDIPTGGGSSIPSQAVAQDNTTRPIITSGNGNNNEIAYISSPSSKSINVKGHAGGSSWNTYTITTGSSDIRLKQNVLMTNITALPIINSIKVRQFDWKSNSVHQSIGFISDELELLDTNLVSGGGYEEDGTLNIKCVDTFYLQGYEVKAIQELSQENQKLKNIILSLQGEIAIIKQNWRN